MQEYVRAEVELYAFSVLAIDFMIGPLHATASLPPGAGAGAEAEAGAGASQ